LLLCLIFVANNCLAQVITVGSKHFSESYVLAEIISQLLEENGFDVVRNFGLGGTLICYQALVNGEIGVYPEYSGTIAQAILRFDDRIPYHELQKHLADRHDLLLLDSFGFENTYAMAVRAEMAARYGLETISQLRDHPDLSYGLSYEYIERGDGWKALAERYRLRAQAIGMEHGLAYQAIVDGKIDVMDVYCTDAEIVKYDLAVLRDDQGFFPKYFAAPLLRQDLPGEAGATLARLSGLIDEHTMRRLNAEVAIQGKSFAEAAHDFLQEQEMIAPGVRDRQRDRWTELGWRTLRHLELTMTALLAAVLMAIPLGIMVYRIDKIARPVIYVTGLLQTIPSLALLALMIPLFGIGIKPALLALFLYALLPILRNTYTALHSVEPIYKRIAVAMGMRLSERLRIIELPLAAPGILAGIRTSAVILIGTATIAAFIGAGGLGEYIITGLSLNDPEMIMWGAIPAALLAILVELLFEALEHILLPVHLRQTVR
jgi:osmoprotectant transport system permease protein